MGASRYCGPYQAYREGSRLGHEYRVLRIGVSRVKALGVVADEERCGTGEPLEPLDEASAASKFICAASAAVSDRGTCELATAY
jgi:hypothetical protein